MTKEGWRILILDCYNDKKRLDLLSELLEQVDLSKQILIDKGYRCTGMSLLEVVKNLPESDPSRVIFFREIIKKIIKIIKDFFYWY